MCRFGSICTGRRCLLTPIRRVRWVLIGMHCSMRKSIAPLYYQMIEILLFVCGMCGLMDFFPQNVPKGQKKNLIVLLFYFPSWSILHRSPRVMEYILFTIIQQAHATIVTINYVNDVAIWPETMFVSSQTYYQ